MISANEIWQQLNALGCNPMKSVMLDANYVQPTRSWIENAFSASLEHNLQALGLAQWHPESWDCDKYARFAWACAGVSYARTPGYSNAGLAFGMFCFVSSTAGPHAINFASTSEGLFFYEPQIRQAIKLNEQEIRSCFAYVI